MGEMKRTERREGRGGMPNSGTDRLFDVLYAGTI